MTPLPFISNPWPVDRGTYESLDGLTLAAGLTRLTIHLNRRVTYGFRWAGVASFPADTQMGSVLSEAHGLLLCSYFTDAWTSQRCHGAFFRTVMVAPGCGVNPTMYRSAQVRHVGKQLSWALSTGRCRGDEKSRLQVSLPVGPNIGAALHNDLYRVHLG